MFLVERLEKRARELSVWKREHGKYGWLPDETLYDQQAADDRELLLEAVKVIRELEKIEAFHLVRNREILNSVQTVARQADTMKRVNDELGEILK